MGKKAVSKGEDQLRKRIGKLEQRVSELHPDRGSGHGTDSHEVSELACAVPELTPREMAPGVSARREELIRYTARKWVNGTILHYYFFETGPYAGDGSQVQMVAEAFDVWRDVGIGLSFERVSNIGQAEIRIGFLPGDGYWSYVGTDVLTIGQQERTMNFGRDLRSDSRTIDVPVHEIGHTLGFPHEHQNPRSGIVWDEQAVFSYFAGPPNHWDESTTRHNILRKIPQGEVDGSVWDRDSIMHYGFPPGLIRLPAQYQENALRPARGLSDMDKSEARFFYPRNSSPHAKLVPFESQRIDLRVGEQSNLSIEPPETRDYTIQTFGGKDSVLVLFEDRGDGNYVYLAGDDDSGWDRNAQLNVRLYDDRRYVARLRLYYGWASGDLSIMMW